jgi:hypothetical protein
MKKIKFYKVGIGPDPVPSKTTIPQWYKDISLYNSSNSLADVKVANYGNGIDGSAISLKVCSPTFDAFSSGYQFVMPEDILIEINDKGVPEISWESESFTINRMPMVEFPIPPFYHPIAFSFRMMFGVSTPPGTSVLVAHPFNRVDLPFYVPTAIVDSDKKFPPADIRFVIKRDFEGVIKKGTPIFQILPFTRESWEMEIDNSITDEKMWEHENRRMFIHSWYTKQLQTIKEYN